MSTHLNKSNVAWWVPGDWNGFFGLFTGVALNVIVLSSLCLEVVEFPNSLVFDRILPALGVALLIGNLFYAYLAYQLAKREGRNDVAALPYGPSVAHMFIVVFLIMLPIYLVTKNPLLAWQAGLAWCFIIGVIVLLGAFVGPIIQKYTPRAAMLGTLVGISITFISMRPVFQSWEVPWISFISLGIIFISWFAQIRMPFNLPGGLVAVMVGLIVGWLARLLGLSDYMHIASVQQSLAQFGLHLPKPSLDVIVGLKDFIPLLVTAIPLGIYNFTEAMSNVESAAASGDSYNLRQVLFADGIGAIVGSILGCPFPPAVYIGHPGWKSVGGRIGYSLATGIAVSIMCFCGLTALLLKILPLVAILPIFIFIGLIIGAQAFQVSPQKHAPAIILAMIPSIAAWAQSQVDSALNAAHTTATMVGFPQLHNAGVIYQGMQLFGSSSVLVGLLLGSIAVFIIDRDFKMAMIYCGAASLLTFFGFIHGDHLGFAVTPQVALGYVFLGAICLYAQNTPRQPNDER